MSTHTMIQGWVKAAQEGEQTAWHFLYQQYYPILYAMALRIQDSPSAAQDTVQDVFLIAFLKLKQLKDAAAFEGWIKKILIHKCYRHVRQKSLCSLDKLPLATDYWWEDELNRKMDSLSNQSRLYKAMAMLPEALRSTVLLRYFTDFQSYEAIASILAIPIGTVRSRLNQAKSKLLAYWQQCQDASLKFFEESKAWNDFYYTTLSGMHRQDDCKNRFIHHLQKDVQILLLGKPNVGNSIVEGIIVEDREYGSWLKPVQVVSSGNISIIEIRHFNSPEFPDHCPYSSVQVLYRNKDKVTRMHLHY